MRLGLQSHTLGIPVPYAWDFLRTAKKIPYEVWD